MQVCIEQAKFAHTSCKLPCQAQAHASLQHKSRCSGLRSHAESKLKSIPINSIKDAAIINAADGLSTVAYATQITTPLFLNQIALGKHA